MKRVFLLNVAMLIWLGGCSSATKNQVTHNQMSIREGSYKNSKWSDHLVFKRTSWFQEISMLFDVLVSEIRKESPFYVWFSDFEKKEIEKCEHFFLMLSYALDDKRLSDGMFVAELKKAGYSLMEIPHFKDNLKLHPEYLNELLEYYKVRGACKNSIEGNNFFVEFPGFTPEKIL